MCFFIVCVFRTMENFFGLGLLTTGCCWLMQFTVNDRLISKCENHFPLLNSQSHCMKIAFQSIDVSCHKMLFLHCDVNAILNRLLTCAHILFHFISFILAECLHSAIFLLYLYCDRCNLWHWLIWNVITQRRTSQWIFSTRNAEKMTNILNNRWIRFMKYIS